MIVLDNDNTPPMHLLGVGLVKISNLDVGGIMSIIFQKGIGIKLIQTIINLNKKKILTKRQGISIDLISDYTVYMHFFNKISSEIILIIYLDKKESILKFSSYYELSKKLNEVIYSSQSSKDLQEICEYDFIIPKSDSLLAFFVISTAGHLFFSKVKNKNSKLGDLEVQISGFISALMMFTKELIGEGPEVELKSINFGNQQIYLVVDHNVIFSYLVEEKRISKLDKKYMQIVSDEFIELFKDYIDPNNFRGDLTKFHNFENIVDTYFTF